MAGLNFLVTANDRNFQNTMNNVQRSVLATTANMERSGQSIEDMFARMSRAAAGFGVAFSAQQFGAKVLEVRGQFQQLEMAFQTMLGSSEKASELMAQMVDTAATTPFDLKCVADGAKQLLAYGVSADEVNDTLIRLGDIAAGLSIPLGDLTYLYGTTMVQGRMYTQDLNQFTNRGIPLIDELAKQFGVAKNQVKTLVEEGKVGFPQVQKAIQSLTNEGGKFGGLMSAQSKTLAGQQANLEDSIDMMFNEIGEKVQDFASDAIEAANWLVENYKKVGTILLSIAAAYGVNKAAQAAYIAGVRSGYDMEIAKLQELLGMKQQVLDADLQKSVDSGSLTADKAQEVQALRDQYIELTKAKLEAAEADEKTAQSDVSGIEATIEALQEQADGWNELADAAEAAGDSEGAEAAKQEANTIQTQISTQQKRLNTAQTNLQTASEQRKIAADNLQTASTMRVTTAEAAHTFKQKAAIIWTNAMTAAQRSLTNAMKALKAAFMSNPFGMIATAVATAVSFIAAFNDETEESVDIAKKLEESMNGAASEAEALYKLLETLSPSTKVYSDTIDKLIETCEKYGITIDEEGDKVKQLTDAHDTLIGVLKEEDLVKQRAAISEAYNEAINKQMGEIQKEIKEELEDVLGKDSTGAIDAYGMAWRQQIQETGEELAKLDKTMEGMTYDNGVLVSLYNTQKNVKQARNGVRTYGEENGKVYKKVWQTEDGKNYGVGKWVNAELTEKEIKQLQIIQSIAKTTGDSFDDAYRNFAEYVVKGTKYVTEMKNGIDDATNAAKQVAPPFDEAANKAYLAQLKVDELKSKIKLLLDGYGYNTIFFEIEASGDFDKLFSEFLTGTQGIGSGTKDSLDSARSVAARYATLLEKMERSGSKTGQFTYSNGQKSRALTEEEVARGAALWSQQAQNLQTAEDSKNAKAEEKKKKAEEAAQKKADAAAEKEKKRLQNIKETAEKYKDAIADAIDALSEDLSEREIELMDEGAEKQLAKLALDYQRQIEAAEKEIEDVATAKYNANKAAGDTSKTISEIKEQILAASETDEEFGALIAAYNKAVLMAQKALNKSADEIGISLADKYSDKNAVERKNKLKSLQSDIKALEKLLAQETDAVKRAQTQRMLNNAQQNFDWIKSDAAAWNEYYKQYGTFLQKRKALEDQFKMDTLGMDESSPEYLMRQKQFEQDSESLHFEEVQQGLDWGGALSDLTTLGENTLETIRQKLADIIALDTQLSTSDKGKLIEKYQEVGDALGEKKQKGSIFSNAWWKPEKNEEEERLKKNLEKKQMEYNVAEQNYITKATANAQAKMDKEKLLKDNGLDSSMTDDEIKEALSKNGDGGQALQQFNNLNTAVDTTAADMGQAATQMSAASKGVEAAQEALNGAGGGAASTMAVVDKVVHGINDNVQSLVGFLDELGVSDSEFARGVQAFAKASQGATDAWESLKKGDFVGVAKGVYESWAYLGDAIEIWMGHDLWGDYYEELEKLNVLKDIWDDLINKKQEYAAESLGSAAVTEAESLKKTLNAQRKATISAATHYGEAHTWRTRSAAYKVNKDIGAEGYAAISAALGRRITTWKDMLTMTTDELYKVMDVQNGDIYAKLDETMRDYLDQIVTINDKAEEVEENLKNSLTQTTFDTVYSDFVNLLSDMDSSAADFSDKFGEYLKNAILQTYIGKKYKEKLENLYDQFAKANEDDRISESETEELRDDYMKIVEQAQQDVKNLKEVYGWSSSDASGSSKSSFSGMTQDQADELNGRFAALQISNQSILNAAIERNAAIGQQLQNLVTLSAGSTEQNGTLSEMRDMQLQSLSCLQTIESNSRYFATMSAKLDLIERNTRNI